jgi:elongation factor Ts
VSIEIDPKQVKEPGEKPTRALWTATRSGGAGGDGKETILRTKGISSAGKKASRVAKEGIVASYIHLQGKVGVLVEVNCETDFVAKNENFRAFVKDITLHVAAAQPHYVSREEVPAQIVEAERAIYAEQVKDKPANVVDKIVQGKLDKYYSTVCLLEQGFIKNPDQTINDLVKSKITELGENIVIRRFTRYQVGEALATEAA